MFTGSTETGSWISQKLAERKGDPVPLIAETGGQNCMIVDSTALPEQVVDDVIASGFQSAGQRCSALRVLFVQEEVADKIITMIKGAMKELHIGDPAYLSTDVGPVIDKKALGALNEHVDYLSDKSTLHYACNQPELAASIEENQHNFFIPRLYEIKDLSVLEKEVFGPIVHVIRYKAKNIENVIDQINGTGFGLTMGIHTRIEDKAHYLAARSRAGNVYVNRNMIGAVVGVQPFGGRGLSGTGPKAGGPLYLTRLVKDKTSIESAELSAEMKTALNNEIAQCHQLADHVNHQLTFTKQQEVQWGFAPLNNKVSILRQLLAQLSASKVVLTQEDELPQTLTDARAQLLFIEKQLAAAKVLPGPTGESNTLYLESRGTVACLRCENTSFNFWMMSVISALSAGNCVVAIVDNKYLAETNAIAHVLHNAGLPEGVFRVVKLGQIEQVLSHETLAGAIVDNISPFKQWVGEYIAARKGAILPLITAYTNESLFYRMVTEKTVTIDTTAAGGNASLMTMESNVG